MKHNENSQIRQVLGEVLDQCSSLRDITGRVLREFSPAALIEMVRERSRVLTHLDSAAVRLRKIAPVYRWQDYEQYGEIREHLHQLAVREKELTLLVNYRMGEIARELSTLSDSSHAARNYTRHSRW